MEQITPRPLFLVTQITELYILVQVRVAVISLFVFAFGKLHISTKAVHGALSQRRTAGLLIGEEICRRREEKKEDALGYRLFQQLFFIQFSVQAIWFRE